MTSPIDQHFNSHPRPLPKPRKYGQRIVGLVALSAAAIEPPADCRMEIADHIGAVLYELAPLTYDMLAGELASSLAPEREGKRWPDLWRGILRELIAERGEPKTEAELRRWIQEAQNRGKQQLGRSGVGDLVDLLAQLDKKREGS